MLKSATKRSSDAFFNRFWSNTASTTMMAKSADDAASFALRRPSFSTGSLDILRPAVSHKTTG